MIIAEKLSKRFDDFLAVDEVSLEIRPGEVMALLGPNGAGKTTTVRMLTSILRPTSGRASVAGYDVVAQPSQVRASVGVLTEQHGLYDRMSASEYMDFFGQVYGMSVQARRERFETLMKSFGLWDDRKRRIGEYSKGMRQKLALARALLHEPPVLLLDEPTSAMDPESARLVRDAILTLRSARRSILICTHNLAEAEELADKIAIIRRGRIIAQGTTPELRLLLLGPAIYEARFAARLDGRAVKLPDGAELVSLSDDTLCYQVRRPAEVNPLLLMSLFEQGLPVVSLQEQSRSLEKVYLQAVSIADNDKEQDAKGF